MDPLAPVLLPFDFTDAFPVVSELLRLPDPVVVRVELLTLTPAEVPEDDRVTVRLRETSPVATMPRRRFSTMVMLLEGALA